MATDGKVDIEIKIEDSKAKSQASKVGKDIGDSVKSGAKTAEAALDGVSSKFGSSFKEGSKAASDAIGGVGDSVGEVAEESEQAGGRFSKAFGSAIPIAAAAAAAAIALVAAKVVEFTKESVGVGMEFDKAMSQVAATMGKTTDEIQELNEFAQEMGATTAFSATQSAEALNYMALAGYDAETAMSMLPTVLNLAAAGNMDLAVASDMVTDAQSALGLSLEETSEMVDKMAMASSKSNTSVQQLGEAFLTVGGTAKNLSGGTTELAQMLGVLADNGIKGAEGGTALRNVILSLSAPTDAAAKKMEELGLAVFDAEGNMRPMPEIFADLNDAMEPLTQQEKTEALNTIFNKVDLKSANALLGTSAERFDELSDSIDGAAGAAQKMADTQLDNLAGDITLLQSATEGFQISISNYLTPSLRALAQVGGNAFSELKAAWDDSMGSGNFTGAGEEIGRQLTNVINQVVSLAPQLISTAVELVGGFLAGIVQSLPSFISAVVTAIVQSIPMLLEATFRVIDALVAALPTMADSLVSAIPEIIGAVAEAIPRTIEVMVAGFTDLINGVVAALPDIVSALVRAMPTIIPMLVNALVSSVEALIQGFITLFTAVIEAIPTIVAALVPMIPEIVNGLVTALVECIPALVEGFVQLFLAFVEATPLIIAEILPMIPQIIATIVASIVQMVPRLMSAAVQLFTGFVGGIAQSIPSIVSKVMEVGSRILSTIGSIPGKMLEVGKNIIQGLWNGIAGSVDWLIGRIKGFCSDALGAIKGFFGIASPSKLMRDVVGVNLAKGIVVGWEMEDPASQIAAQLERSFGEIEDKAKAFSIDIGAVTADSISVGFDRNNPMSQIADTMRSGFNALSVMAQSAGSVTNNSQTLNFNQPVSSPDQIARAMRMQQRYGLAGANI